MAIQWHQSPTRGFDRVGRQLPQKPDLPVLKEVYSVEYDSVLGQQSISGKNVSLILCVWKPCYVKSGHICYP